MSALSRFGPAVARSLLVQQHRQMASASVATEPIQKLFVDKIREIKTSNKGLDAAHEKLLRDEMLRLRRVYAVDDDNKLAQLDHKFGTEHDVSLRDIDSSKELRASIESGEFQKQLAAKPAAPSALLATTPDQTQHDLCLPPLNKPDMQFIFDNHGPPRPIEVASSQPDYFNVDSKMTPERLEREMLVHFGPDMPTIHDDASPQRDAVNFPRQQQMLDTPPTRHHIIPESWFQFFYPKTGVTGPYAFFFCFGSFLMSKEWLVMEHELLTGFSSVAIFAYAIPKYGPKIREWMVNGIKKEYEDWDNFQQGNSKALGDLIAHYKTQFGKDETIGAIYDARRQDVELQLEAEYRRRLKTVYDDTKRRLNYLVAVANSQRQIHHANLVNMVISNVMSSFGPKQETETLDNCIVNLRSLANKHANAI